MALWFSLKVNADKIGLMEIRRREDLNLHDPAAIADVVCTYRVIVDGVHVAEVRHRYGDGAWKLVALAAEAASTRVGCR